MGALDRLELSGPYVRETVAVVAIDGERGYAAQAYPVRDPDRWAEMVRVGRADALGAHPRDLAAAATLKPCCEALGHPPPHDVVDPLSDTLPRRRA